MDRSPPLFPSSPTFIIVVLVVVLLLPLFPNISSRRNVESCSLATSHPSFISNPFALLRTRYNHLDDSFVVGFNNIVLVNVVVVVEAPTSTSSVCLLSVLLIVVAVSPCVAPIDRLLLVEELLRYACFHVHFIVIQRSYLTNGDDIIV